MDITALFNLSYGLYVIGSKDGERHVGCLVNTVTQSTVEPVTLTVCVNKDNYTNECIKATGSFSVSILSEQAKSNVFGVFGFASSRERDKFAEVPMALTPSGLPYLSEGVTGFLQCKVIGVVENFTHTIFIGEVEEAENVSKETPMTYAYYHSVIRGKTPKNASTYVAEEQKPQAVSRYVCDVCGFEYPGPVDEFEALPDDYKCPICHVPKSRFSLRT